MTDERKSWWSRKFIHAKTLWLIINWILIVGVLILIVYVIINRKLPFTHPASEISQVDMAAMRKRIYDREYTPKRLPFLKGGTEKGHGATPHVSADADVARAKEIKDSIAILVRAEAAALAAEKEKKDSIAKYYAEAKENLAELEKLKNQRAALNGIPAKPPVVKQEGKGKPGKPHSSAPDGPRKHGPLYVGEVAIGL